MAGAKYERELATALFEQGFQVMRGPSSGAGTKRPCPDVFAGDPNHVSFAIELKTTNDGIGYVTREEIEELETFAAAFLDAEPVAAFRFKGDRTFYLHDPAELRQSSRSDSLACEHGSERGLIMMVEPSE